MNDMTPIGARTLRHAADLAAAGLVPRADVPALDAVAERYAVAVTPAMADLINASDPADPIARQFMPSVAELQTTPEERADPIGDKAHEVTPGLIHRYPDRVLMKLVSACAVYCRFCFRRETVGQGEAMTAEDITAALAYIRARPEIFEVILSGGDPLVVAQRRLASLVAEIGAIAHIAVVRVHTRVPLVAPERITPDLVAALKAGRATPWLALHVNHPRELTPDGLAALARLADAGIPLVSQTVLLRGINDDADTLAALMRALVAARVKPYYLHHGDLAPGTAYFRTSIAEGQALVRELRARVSGLAQPMYVLDIPGGHGKVPIGPAYLGDGDIADVAGERHAYPPRA